MDPILPPLDEYAKKEALPADPSKLSTAPYLPAPESARQVSTAADTPGPPPGQAPVFIAIGVYQLLDKLAQGGMGIVYRARHTVLDRVVALKTMRADGREGSDAAVRFEREMRAVARLQHPHIVPIYDVGQHEGRAYYTMALLPGGPLSAQRERLQSDPRAVVVLMEKIARAMHYAHEHGIIHRDLKPSNVLLDERGEPMVNDFGLAKLHDTDEDLTHTGMVLGTPSYMAPEQAAGRTHDIGPATDVWALGVMLYEFLAGHKPFQGTSGEEIKRKVLTAEPVPLRSVRRDLDPSLQAICAKCLRKDPLQRYESAKDLADDLHRYLEGKTTIAESGEPWPRRVLRKARRHPGKATALGVWAVVCLVSAAVLIYPRTEARAPGLPESLLDPPVILIGDSGPPAKYHFAVGEKESLVVPARQEEPFTIRTKGLCLVELLAAVPWTKFRLEAEVRHDKASLGRTGLYFAYSRQPEDHCFWSLCYGEHGTDIWPGRADFAFGRYGIAPPHFFSEPAFPNGIAYFGRAANADAWRKIAVEVSPKEINAFLDNLPIAQPRFEEVRAKHEHYVNQVPGAKTEFTPWDGGVGIYLTHGSSSYRRVVVKPFP